MGQAPSDKLFNKGVISVVNAQFFSALADNILFFALLEFLNKLDAVKESTYLLQACFLFSYILLAPVVGLFADNQPKSKVLMIGNGIKLLGVALLCFNVSPFLCYGIVGLGAAVYSPAKFGILGELVTNRLLVKVNGLVEGSTIFAILLGAYLGGLLAKNYIVMAFTLAASMYAIALIFNLFIPKIKAKRKDSFSPKFLLHSFWLILKRLAGDKQARFAILGTSLFWGAASTLRLLLNDWTGEVLKEGIDTVAILSAIVSIGIVFGALVASLFISVKNIKWCLWSGLGMGIITIIFAYQTNIYSIYFFLILIGLLGGIFVIPMNALLQERGKLFESAGTAIAVQNFSENLVMILMMFIFGALAFYKVSIISLMICFGVLFSIGILGLFYHIGKRNVLETAED